MTLAIYNFTEHIRLVPYKYNLQANITRNHNERQKELGHYRHLDVKQFIRKKILERDNYTCQLCGQYGNQVDHIKPWRLSHDNSPENLRILCVKCNIATRLERRDARLNFDEWADSIRAEIELYKEKPINPKIRLATDFNII